MNFLITMAGKGQRFVDAGYLLPKMLISVKGKTLLEWSLDSLPIELATRLIFVLLNEHEEHYQISEIIKKKYGHLKLSIHFKYLSQVTRGQAETAIKALDLIDFTKDLLIFNIDTSFHSSKLKSSLLYEDCDGVLGAFKSNSEKFSFAKLSNTNNFIEEVAEKKVISDIALTGLYHFRNPKLFFEETENMIRRNILIKGEFYIAPVYNKLIEKGEKFIVDFCDEIDILGTPQEIDIFKNK